MKTQFPIKEGTLEFIENRIEIRDKWKFARFAYYFQYCNLAIFSLIAIIYVVKSKPDDGIRLFWLVYLIIAAIFLIYRIFNPERKVFDSSLQIDQIAKVVMESYSYDKLSAVFYLKNGTRRLIDLDFDRFWRADLQQSLAERNVDSELR